MLMQADIGSQSNPADRARASEWQEKKRWNPFNSNKLLAHVGRWKKIRRGRPVPAPALITVDPTNVCNFNCAWCNAEYIRQHRHFSLSENVLADLAGFLTRWGSQGFGVDAICIAGGGEPLLNPATAGFIDRVVASGIEVGMVTNGSFIANYIDSLSQCTWIGVSMDAGTAASFNKLKGLPGKSQIFEQTVNTIAVLADYAKTRHTRLGMPHPAYGVSYKFLLYPGNIGEIYAAAKLAKETGCKNIHFRPAGTPWDKINTLDEIRFSEDDTALFREQIALAMELDSQDFGVYGITHKFTDQFERCNSFDRCHSVFMTAVISPPSCKEAPKDSFVMGLCCDRRGSDKLELLRDEQDVERIAEAWGGKAHWAIHDAIDVARECPRCTYQPHNQIYEHVILNDSMTYKFI